MCLPERKGQLAMIRAVGIEIVAVQEVSLRRGQDDLKQIFTASELAYCSGWRKASLHLAARYAAKKAILKALCHELPGDQEVIPLTDIEIQRFPSGCPYSVLHGAAASRASRMHITGWYLSLTHTDQWAAAFVVAEEQ
jgi:holo-[acyl-carrier protein] synthase